METIFGGVTSLSGDWRAWVVAAIVVMKAIHSVYAYMQCPVLCGRLNPDEKLIAEAKNYQFRPGFRFLAIMTAGMALAIAGLYGISYTEFGALALGAMVIGIFMFLTEPNRLTVNNAKMDVFASTGAPGEAEYVARENLKSAHLTRSKIEVGIAIGVVALLCLS